MRATGLPFAFVMRKDDVAGSGAAGAGAPVPGAGPARRLGRCGAKAHARRGVGTLLPLVPEEGRSRRHHGQVRPGALHPGRPAEQHLYQVGSMGGASGMGLGVALNAGGPVLVLDGDGAALMKLGTLPPSAPTPAEPGPYSARQRCHDCTGGQPTVSPRWISPAVALACGYRYAASCETLDGFEAAFGATARPGPALIHVADRARLDGEAWAAEHQAARGGATLQNLPGRPGEAEA